MGIFNRRKNSSNQSPLKNVKEIECRALLDPCLNGGWKTGDWKVWKPPLRLVKGESNYRETLLKIAGEPRENGYLIPIDVTLIREPANPYDKNALRVEVENELIGYINRVIAKDLSSSMDALGCAKFTIAGLIRGGFIGAENLGVHIWLEKRLTLGPELNIEKIDEYQVTWPPGQVEGLSEDEVALQWEKIKAKDQANALRTFEASRAKPDSKKPGYYKGRHYTAYVDSVESLKRANRIDEAEELLLGLVTAVEAEDNEKGFGVAPWYYEQLAILYRKQNNPKKEVLILERYGMQRHATGPSHAKLIERLEKARKRLEKFD